MSVTTLTSFDEIQQFTGGGTAVVDFAKRNGCVPCRRLAPHYELAAQAVDGVSFGVVYLDELDAEDFMRVVGVYGLRATPTVYMFSADGTTEIQERTAPLLIKEINSLLT